MAKYLDYDGLGYLWEKITKYVNSQINTQTDAFGLFALFKT